MLPEVKVYKIDYDFIIKNYLDKNLWKKVWNLFVYKEHIFTLNLYQIDTKNDKIVFEIHKNNYSDYELVYYDLKNTSIKILIQQINGAIFRVMCSYEENEIRKTDGYITLLNAQDEERDQLRDIATSFLDDHDVSNENVREAYIDAYIDKVETVWKLKDEYVSQYKYNMFPDMFLVFCKITNDINRLIGIKSRVNNKNQLYEIEQKVNEFLEYIDTDTYKDDMALELEDI